MLRVALLTCLTLAACSGDVPTVDATISDAARAQPYPTLGPIDALLTDAARPSRAKAAGSNLRVRGTALAGRGISAPGGESLDARGARLRARAAELRAVDI
ncbi:hypothetical protein [Jannaschia sp. 2305UL9-9]|uniref:hypothetical protein n=1 Tax=Jannaschia sp. 2305UL9-9 TaxID=3121638 RepID=UPI0035297B26